MMNNPFLIGQKIYLQPMEIEILSQEYVEWLNDSTICEYNSHAILPNITEKTKTYIGKMSRSKNDFVFAIKWKEDNTHIGNVSLQQIDWLNRSGEIAILIGNKNFWGKGIATECYNLLIEYGFERLNLNRIYSGLFEENIAMKKVCEKINMRFEGSFRETIFKNGEYKNLNYYSILKREYSNQKI